MIRSATELSRLVSHALRHEPWLYELEPDEHGWVPVDQLLDAIRRMGPQWMGVERADLESMIASSAKRRHEIVNDRIRALYGHSLKGIGPLTPSSPPPILFHGTSPDAWADIEGHGLRPMGRRYVHMSVDRVTALAVGRRKTSTPTLLRINAEEAASAGVTFYQAAESIWLADGVPSRFIERST